MPPSPPHPPPLTLFLDFDGTLTHADTLAALASIPSSLRTTPAPLPPFSHFAHAYLAALAAHTAAYAPPAPRRTTPALELAFLAARRPVEAASVQRVEAAALFRGLRRADLLCGAARAVRSGEVRVRAGWAALLRHVRAREGARVCVVSVNWSRAWVGAVLGLRGGEAGGVEVVANEVVGLDEREGGTGGLDRWWGVEGGGVWTSEDKGRVVRERMGGWSVYVGDGVGDLEGLLGCDVGVCVRDGEMGSGQRELRDVLERVGVECRWVGEWRGERGEGERLWWARGLEEIVRSGVLDGGR
ncbi:hypothetical protein MMC11_002896 [Xylographa trunciseda]|nr:hypothetical protein [Xylographa trunciseda]